MPVDYRYSTFGPRFWAGVIDGLVFLPFDLLNPYLSSPARPAVVLIAWALFSYPAYWIYEVSLHTYRGQTIGKRAQGVKVMDLSEQKLPSLKQALLRDIGTIVSNTCTLAYFVHLVLAGKYDKPFSESLNVPMMVLAYAGFGWFLLEIITMLTNSKRRALHDVIAGTVVVRVDSVPAPIASEGTKEPSTA